MRPMRALRQKETRSRRPAPRRTAIFASASAASAAFWLALAPAPALACSCLTPETRVIDQLRSGAMVALGAPTHLSGGGHRPVIYRFSVAKALNAQLPSEITLRTAPNEAACGVRLRPDREVVVMLFPSDRPGTYSINLCGQLTVRRFQADWESLFDAMPD